LLIEAHGHPIGIGEDAYWRDGRPSLDALTRSLWSLLAWAIGHATRKKLARSDSRPRHAI